MKITSKIDIEMVDLSITLRGDVFHVVYVVTKSAKLALQLILYKILSSS